VFVLSSIAASKHCPGGTCCRLCRMAIVFNSMIQCGSSRSLCDSSISSRDWWKIVKIGISIAARNPPNFRGMMKLREEEYCLQYRDASELVSNRTGPSPDARSWRITPAPHPGVDYAVTRKPNSKPIIWTVIG
jgi:hypothetical protein